MTNGLCCEQLVDDCLQQASSQFKEPDLLIQLIRTSHNLILMTQNHCPSQHPHPHSSSNKMSVVSSAQIDAMLGMPKPTRIFTSYSSFYSSLSPNKKSNYKKQMMINRISYLYSKTLSNVFPKLYKIMGESFNPRSYLSYHEIFKCDVCEKEFDSPSKLGGHKSRNHKTEVKEGKRGKKGKKEKVEEMVVKEEYMEENEEGSWEESEQEEDEDGSGSEDEDEEESEGSFEFAKFKEMRQESVFLESPQLPKEPQSTQKRHPKPHSKFPNLDQPLDLPMQRLKREIKQKHQQIILRLPKTPVKQEPMSRLRDRSKLKETVMKGNEIYFRKVKKTLKPE